MDLLGGYNSDSDSDDASASPPLSSQPKPSATKPTVAAKPAPSLTNPSFNKKTAKSASSSNRKGKRLLKLQAVLPENIWNQLSNGNLQKDSDDEDSDEENKGKRTITSRKRTKPASGNINASENPGDKSDLTNLLQALPKSKAGAGRSGGSSGKSFLHDSDDFSETIVGAPSSSTAEAKKSSPAPLGAAFLSTTVETVRKKKAGGTSTVRDIHGQSSSRMQNDTDSDGESGDNDNAADNATAASKQLPSSHASVPSSNSVPRPRISSISSSRGSAISRIAAPTVSVSRNQQQPQPSYPLPPDVMPYATTVSYPVATSVPPLQGKPGGKKISRKREMERMLRQGNLAGVTTDVHLEGQAHVYQPPQEQQQQAYQKHGVRIVPTSQYNTSTGGMAASISISGKQRGKNQMNALLSSAVSLEAQRARSPVPQQKVQRANAKRKYGW
ncbi:MAG: hypothetical protein SGBAC_012563 [Bacillariaceae sp.]